MSDFVHLKEMAMLEQIEIGVVTFVLGAIMTYFAGKWSGIFKKIDALEAGVRAILRDRMCQMHKYYMEKKKPIPQRELDSFDSMYRAYEGLTNSNGYMEAVRHDIFEVMPHETR